MSNQILNQMCIILYAILLFLPAQNFGKRNQPLRLPKFKFKNTLSIQDAVDIAYTNRSSLRAREFQTQIERNLQFAALSGYFPQVHIDVSGSKRARNLLHPVQSNALFNQLIFSFSGPIEEFFIVRQNKIIAQIKELFEKDLIQFETERSYLQLWNLTRKEKAITLLDIAAQEQIDRAKNQNQIGLLGKPEWLGQLASFAQQQAQVFSYDDQLFGIKSIFQQAIEQEFTRDFNVQNILEFLSEALRDATVPLDIYLEKAFHHRKELDIKEQEIERESYIKSLNERSYLPSANLFVDINNGTITEALNSPDSKTFWEMGIRFNWDFDGFGNAHRAAAANSAMTARLMEKLDLMNTIKAEVQTTYAELQEQLKLLDAQTVRIQQEESIYQHAKIRYEIGEVSQVDFARSEQIWQQAQYDLLNQKVQTATKQRELLFKCGYPNIDQKLRKDAHES